MNTVIYLRKSRNDPEAESIDDTLKKHKETLLKVAEQSGLSVIRIYKEVVSGDGLFSRPEMVQLLSDAEADEFEAVLCMDIDRLGRSSQKDSGIILETFKEHGIKIITPLKTYDLNDEIDEMTTEMQTFIARQELKSITRRLQRGMKKSLEDGCHIFEPAYGYKRIYVEKRPTLEIYEPEAEVVRMIFDMYVNQRLGSYIISDKINQMGYKTRKGGTFSRNTVRFILQNPVYTGKIVWNKRHHIKKKHPGDKHKTVPNPQEDWIIANGLHKPIISDELFKQAQEIRSTRSHPPSYTGELKNPFAGLLYCSKCGTAIVRQLSPKTGPRLLCPTTGCCHSVVLVKVEEYLKNILEETLLDLLTEQKKPIQNDLKMKKAALTSELSAAKREIKTLNTQKSALYDLLEQGVYTTEVFLERSRVISQKMDKAQANLEDVTARLNACSSIPDFRRKCAIISHLLDNYETLSPADINSYLKQFIKRIEYHYPKDADTFTLLVEFC